MRTSLIPSKRINTVTVKPQVGSICVGCSSPVKPGFCYTGSVLSGMAFHTVNGTETTPVLGTMETHERSYVLGGETVRTSKAVGFFTRKKGFICDRCAGNYKTITDKHGVRHEIVKTDPRAGYLGETAACETGNKITYRTLNTRTTQSRHLTRR